MLEGYTLAHQEELNDTLNNAACHLAWAMEQQPENLQSLADLLNLTNHKETCRTAVLMLAAARSAIPNIPQNPQSAERRRWQNLREEDSSPILPLAKMADNILKLLPATTRAGTAIEMARLTSENMNRRYEHDDSGHPAGYQLQHMPENRRERGVFHTRETSATLMASLALTGESVKNAGPAARLRIADYACGAGTLLTAACRRAIQLGEANGERAGEIHQELLQDGIYGCDVSAAAVTLTAHNLAALQPQTGAQAEGLWTAPVKNGELGALELLKEAKNEPETLKFKPGLDAVLINPPFTKPNELEHPQAQERMKELNNRLGAVPGTTIACAFAQLALRSVRPGGSIGLILPLTSLMGAPPRTRNKYRGQTKHGWQEVRNSLTRNFTDVKVISIAQYLEKNSTFCHKNTIADVMITARRLKAGEKAPGHATFVNLSRTPETVAEAEKLADSIQEASKLQGDAGCARLDVNGTDMGFAVRAEIKTGQAWPISRILDPDMVAAMAALKEGVIRLDDPRVSVQMPLRKTGRVRKADGKTAEELLTTALPMTSMSELGQMHNAYHTLVRDFSREVEEYRQQPDQIPILKGHTQPGLDRILVEPAQAIHALPERKKQAERTIDRNASQLHLNDIFRLNSQATAACLTTAPTLGDGGWPSFILHEPELAPAVALWLNTTPGLIGLWSVSCRTQNGLAMSSENQIATMPVLDFRAISPEQLEAMNQVCRDAATTRLMPASAAWEDEARDRLDSTVLQDIMGFSAGEMEKLRKVRAKWCLEPTVQGRKGQSKPKAEMISRLKEAAGQGG